MKNGKKELKTNKTTVDLITLYVERKRFGVYHIETTLKDSTGKVKAIFNSMLRQPRKGQRTILINCNRFALDWSNVI